MRVTVMGQIAKGIATDELDIEKPLERMKREIFGRWYPGMQTGTTQQQKAA
jgi:hypothetical protein